MLLRLRSPTTLLRVGIGFKVVKRVSRDAASGRRQRESRTKSGKVVEHGWRIHDRTGGARAVRERATRQREREKGERKKEKEVRGNYVRESIKRANT